MSSSASSSAAQMAESKISLKLWVHGRTRELAYAEADQDFVDFLFHNLSLPVGILVSLLSKDDLVGSFGTLYKSVQDLPDGYMSQFVTKSCLLQPSMLNNVYGSVSVPNGFLLPGLASSLNKRFYRCSHCSVSRSSNYVADSALAVCPVCKKSMTHGVTYVPATAAGKEAAASVGLYVKGMVKYMVMDDLEVKPLSTVGLISVLSRFRVMDLSEFDVVVVQVGVNEGNVLIVMHYYL